MDNFFIKYEMNDNKRKSRKVEELIQKYSLELYVNYQKPRSEGISNDEDDTDNYLLLRADFDNLIHDIQQIYVSKNYMWLMSWLIDRAFCITVGAKRNHHVIQSTINNNKAILLKTLYVVNPQALLKCFSKGVSYDT